MYCCASAQLITLQFLAMSVVVNGYILSYDDDCVKRPSSSLCRLRRFKTVYFTLHLHYIMIAHCTTLWQSSPYDSCVKSKKTIKTRLNCFRNQRMFQRVFHLYVNCIGWVKTFQPAVSCSLICDTFFRKKCRFYLIYVLNAWQCSASAWRSSVLVRHTLKSCDKMQKFSLPWQQMTARGKFEWHH